MTRSDDFSADTKRQIASRSAYMCAYPDCFAPTSGPADHSGRSVNIGEAAHITAAQPGGARYDGTLTPEQRKDPDNGIWMCRTHAALIDRDVDRFPATLLKDWKDEAEDRARKLLGKPVGCAKGILASVSPATRLGAETTVVIDQQCFPYTNTFDADAEDAKLSWFVNALVIQFSIQKNHMRKNTVLDHLIVTVHETKPIPEYRMLMGVYPAEASLFYVEIDSNPGLTRREFRPTSFYHQATDGGKERRDFPPAIVLDDDVPARIALRINAKTAGMYLVSIDAAVSSGTDRETLPVMPVQWMIFEQCRDDYDPECGA